MQGVRALFYGILLVKKNLELLYTVPLAVEGLDSRICCLEKCLLVLRGAPDVSYPLSESVDAVAKVLEDSWQDNLFTVLTDIV